jgi:hypothetical protein
LWHLGLALSRADRWIDPSGGWLGRWFWWLVDEALWVVVAGAIEGLLARGVDGLDLAVMHLVRGHEADPGVMMILVVPVEELAAEGPGIGDAAKAAGKARLVLQGLEVALGERVVCALARCIALPGENPGRQTLAPAGSTRGGSGGDEWFEAPREKAP